MSFSTFVQLILGISGFSYGGCFFFNCLVFCCELLISVMFWGIVSSEQIFGRR